MSTQNITEVVKEKYGQAALRVVAGAKSSCCGGAPADAHCADPITGNLYGSELSEVPKFVSCETGTCVAVRLELISGCVFEAMVRFGSIAIVFRSAAATTGEEFKAA